MHWSVFAIVLLLALVSLRSPTYAAISIASYLAVIVIHETVTPGRRGASVTSARVNMSPWCRRRRTGGGPRWVKRP